MLEDAEHLLFQRILRHTVVVIQPRLSSPADIQCRGHIVSCPLEYLGHLFPIAHLLKVEMLYRCTRDDESIILMLAHLLKVGIEGLHMLYRRILRRMALHLHEAQLYLQR